MSNNSWSVTLRQRMLSLRKTKAQPRIAIVGIGHELCGDDAAGLMVVRKLQTQIDEQPNLLIIEGGSAPENHTNLLRRFAPNLVLLIDAAAMGEPPGSIRCPAWETITGISASTHTLPLHLLSTYLRTELGCEVVLIGIQPQRLTLGQPMSPAVRKAVDKVSRSLYAIFARNPGAPAKHNHERNLE